MLVFFLYSPKFSYLDNDLSFLTIFGIHIIITKNNNETIGSQCIANKLKPK